MVRAIERGVAFLLGADPARAEYPTGWAEKPSGNWWKFGFSVFYVTDLLQNVEVLVGLGVGRDPRLAAALDLIRGKQDAAGSASIWYLDQLDEQGRPHSEHLADHYQGFKQPGADGWRLVQVSERPAAEEVYAGPVRPSTHYYFTRSARAKGVEGRNEFRPTSAGNT